MDYAWTGPGMKRMFLRWLAKTERHVNGRVTVSFLAWHRAVCSSETCSAVFRSKRASHLPSDDWEGSV